MKKTKLIMPIIGISATCASFAPLATLTSCNSNKFSVEMTKGSKEQQLYANTKVLNLFFRQSDTTNYEKTKVRIVDLKVNGADASVVSGLTKTTADAGGNIRVTLDITTMYSHYSNPSSIEFDILFANKENNTSYTVEGFKLNIDQTKEVPNPFVKDATDPTIITGFTSDTTYTMAAYAQSYPDVFVPISIPTTNTSAIYYKMVIPASFTGIGKEAFYYDSEQEHRSTIPDSIIELDFAPDSLMETIGDGAFVYSPFIFVTLPKSIKTLGESCFCNTERLMSLKFAPESANNISLPFGFLLGSAIPYLKLPNYITAIKCKDAYPSIQTTSKSLYLDFCDWGEEQIATLAKGWETGSITKGDKQGLILIGNENTVKSIQAVFTSQGITLSSTVTPYKYTIKKSTTNVAVTPLNTLTNVLSGIGGISYNVLKEAGISLPGPLYRIELPNFYWEDKDKYTVTTISQGTEPLSNLTSGHSSSIVLPINLESLYTDFLKDQNFLWQLYIPSTVTTIGEYALGNNKYLTSIIYDGTIAQWKAIEKYEDEQLSAWHYGCPDITVTCTDGTTTVDKIQTK